MWYIIPLALLLIIIIALLTRKEWVVRKCNFPYPEGYATYNRKTKTILDTGLSKEEAKYICKELNKA